MVDFSYLLGASNNCLTRLRFKPALVTTKTILVLYVIISLHKHNHLHQSNRKWPTSLSPVPAWVSIITIARNNYVARWTSHMLSSVTTSFASAMVCAGPRRMAIFQHARNSFFAILFSLPRDDENVMKIFTKPNCHSLSRQPPILDMNRCATEMHRGSPFIFIHHGYLAMP